jgi:hypothetical protein
VTAKRSLLALILPFAGVFVFSSSRSLGDEPPADATQPPAYEQFFVIPLRVHILTAADLPEVDCHLSDADIQRILSKVNRIWNKAGIHWGLESIVKEPAARQARFRIARELDGPGNLALFRILIPEASRPFEGINVYYVHQFPVNGVWMGEDFAIVQETAKLRPVEGGIDEPVPRVTAHELGHALGLSHRQARTNLLASGTTGTSLNTAEVETARRQALRIPGVATVEGLRQAARKAAEAGDVATARRSWLWLSQIPGDAAEDAKKQLGELEPDRKGEALEGNR